MARTKRRPGARTIAQVTVLPAVLVQYSVLVPIHAAAYGVPVALSFLLGAAVCGAPLLAITRPWWAIAVFAAGALTLPLLVSPGRDPSLPWPWSVPTMIAFAILVAVVTLLHGWRPGLAAYLVNVGVSLIVLLLHPTAVTPNAATADVIVATSVAGLVYLVAVLLAGRLRIGQELSRERELSAAEQSRRVQVEERARIARELHDVVAHSLSVIQVQASTARYRLPGLPDEAVRELDDIAANARASLTEMRRLLGVLRTEDQAAELAPQQGIDDIAALVDSVRRAGVQVGLGITAADVSEIPASVQIATFRIVQEALSNAVRHAPGAAIAVSVSADDTAVRLRIHNDVGDAASGQGTGHGLRGMRERATLLGGTLDAGPGSDGGWTVSAVLPWPRQENP
ncbi:sensor histidine kinase [Microbacterium invictum]|uniref:histidine kinase n=1 Tax=Microbacterium invictum TaxID=515415 RepID=A0AA40VLE0_9MICO|nr:MULTISPECIES: sensor histidine kinase [Microbacterium]MBB4139291.1 signal transduction histidine kinase [Microbacterium invictum]